MQPNDRRIGGLPVQVDVGERWRQVLDLLEVAALADPVQHRLDMLAGPQLVGREVRAGAVVGAPLQGADVHPVADREVGGGGDGTRGPDTERGLPGRVLDLHLERPRLTRSSMAVSTAPAISPGGRSGRRGRTGRPGHGYRVDPESVAQPQATGGCRPRRRRARRRPLPPSPRPRLSPTNAPLPSPDW